MFGIDIVTLFLGHLWKFENWPKRFDNEDINLNKRQFLLLAFQLAQLVVGDCGKHEIVFGHFQHRCFVKIWVNSCVACSSSFSVISGMSELFMIFIVWEAFIKYRPVIFGKFYSQCLN